MSLAGVGLALRRTPGWVWGLLSGAGAAVLVALRLRQAHAREEAAGKRAEDAEDKARHAELRAEDVKLEGDVARARETAASLHNARVEAEADGATIVDEVENLSDDDLEGWLKDDLRRRRDDKP